MKHLPLFLLLASCGVATVGDGRIKSESRTGALVTQVSIEDAFEAQVIIGDGPSLEITTDENILPWIETVVENDTLIIRAHKGHAIAPTQLKMELHLPALDTLDASGASKVTLHAQASSSLSLTASGASEIIADGLALETLTAGASGASHLSIVGTGKALTLDASGASSVDGDGLALDSADVTLSGASHATLHIATSVSGDLSGASNLHLTSTPTQTPHVSTSGASSLTLP